MISGQQFAILYFNLDGLIINPTSVSPNNIIYV